MVQGLLAFTFAALLALVGYSGSQDRAPLQVSSDAAAQTTVMRDGVVN